MKNIVISGRTGKDAELRRLQDGTPVLSFSVAVDDGFGESKKTMWFDCSMFGNRGQALEKHLVKGTPVTVAGDFGEREHAGKVYKQIRVNDVTLQGMAKEQTSTTPARTKREEPAGSYGAPDLSDEIPFVMEWR
jgi:single-strand DNA-binding protein